MSRVKLKLYNTLSQRKEAFNPIRKDWVGLYTCGPTVYNFAHIGNLRTYIFEDILRRTLEYAGYKVRHVMNITDVDDKIIRDAQKSGKSIFEFVKPYEKAFFDDLKKLSIEKAWKYPRATSHVREMTGIIQKLIRRGVAYQMGGSVYFDISKFKSYGRLARLQLKKLKTGTRVDLDEYTKKDVQDFALWKERKSGEPFWKTPFGKGHPGWHIECSAMSMKYLGTTFDIHTGGVDNIFPHHENEIAQSESATGKKFVRYWIHSEHLLVNGEKMSKSLGNIFTLRDIESKSFNPLAFRYLTLTSHYRAKLNFTWESLAAAENSLNRLYDFVKSLKAERRNPHNYYRGFASIVKRDLDKAILNNLDTPRALAVIWNLIRQYHKNPERFNPRETLKLLYNFDKVLGLGLKSIQPETVPQKIRVLVKKREDYRKNKLWGKADEIREEIKKLGLIVEDTYLGPNLKKIK